MLKPGWSRLLVAGLAALLFSGTGSAQERVGVSSAVNPEASGAPPGQAARRLVIGQQVVFNERITTQEAGQSQLLFLDESSLSIGPNSDVTVDQFVYDPRTGAGKLAMTSTKGLLRFVGGKLSKQDEAVTMRTNSATLAIRGGAFLLDQSPTGALQAVFIYGRGLTVTGTTGASQTLQRPGFAVTIAGPGAAPSAPFPVPPGQLAQLVSRLDGRRGASGGARTVPTEQAVAASGVEQTISGNISASVQQARAQAQTAVAPSTVNPATVQTQTNVQQASTSAVPCAAQGTCAPQTITSSPTTTQTTTTTTTGAYGGFYKTTPGTGSSVGFVSFDPSFNIPYTGGQIGADGFYTANLNGSTIRFPVNPNGGLRNFTPADGTTSPFGPIAGTSFLSGDRTFLFANSSEVDFSDEHSFVYGGIPVNSRFFQPPPTTQITTYVLAPDATQNSLIPFTTNSFGAAMPNPSVSRFFIVAPPNSPFGSFNSNTNPSGTSPRTLQASLAINGAGPSQGSLLLISTGSGFTSSDTGKVALTGGVRGSFQPNGTPANQVRLGSGFATVPDAAGNNLFGTNTLTGFVIDQNNYTTTENFQQQLATASPFSGTATNYAFNHPAVTTSDPNVAQLSLPPYVQSTRTTQTQTGYFGGIMYPRPGSPYVASGTTTLQTDAAGNRVAATFTGADPFTASSSGVSSLAVNFGTVSSRPFARTAFIDDNVFAARESPDQASQINGTALPLPPNQNNAPQLGLVSSATVPIPSGTFPGVTFCDCQYLKWGFWTGQLNQVNSTNTAITRSDRAFVNTFIAGVPTSATDIASLAGTNITGNYAGHAIGSVNNNGASYLAAGNFSASYNFATQIGSVAISNFDGRNFGASGPVPLSGASFSAPINGTGIAGGFNGTFYGPAAANVGGNFALRNTSGTPYLASGIFAGKR
jgi:trimeric autotransporter adhesin